MRILKKELEKIIHMPMLWVFIAICFVLNTGIIFVYRQRVVDYDYVCYVGQARNFHFMRRGRRKGC